MMNTRELSERTGVPVSTLKLWIRDGILRPAMTGYGKGESHAFDEHNEAQVHAILKIREWFGDGRAARIVLEKGVPQVRQGMRTLEVQEFLLEIA